MTAKRTAAYLGGASLLAAWLASAAGIISQPPAVPETIRPVQTAGTETLAADVQAQALRLRERLAAAPEPQQPLRNPFEFKPRPAERTRRAPADPIAAVLPPPVMDVEPVLSLIGIAEDATPKGPVRTALITNARGELLTVTIGQALEGRYRVSAIDADAVALVDSTTGGTRRLLLR